VRGEEGEREEKVAGRRRKGLTSIALEKGVTPSSYLTEGGRES